MNIVGLIMSLVSGAVGGNVAGAVMKDKSLGTVGNSISGILENVAAESPPHGIVTIEPFFFGG